MGFVDLRGRADEVEVRELLAGCGDPGRVVLGWDEEGALAACIAVVPGGGRELELCVIVAERFRRRGIGRALVEAVVAGSPAERFVARPGGDGFFVRCGFAALDGRLVRTVPVRAAAAEEVRAVTLAALEAAIRGAWARDTSADPDEWTPDNPARGQCDATAVVVRGHLGGEIVIADVLRGGRRVERHAWNRLPGGLMVDLTREQFRGGEQLGEPAAREPLLLGDAAERHALLARRVAGTLSRDGV